MTDKQPIEHIRKFLDSDGMEMRPGIERQKLIIKCGYSGWLVIVAAIFGAIFGWFLCAIVKGVIK